MRYFETTRDCEANHSSTRLGDIHERGVVLIQVLVITPLLIVLFLLFGYVGRVGHSGLQNRKNLRACAWEFAEKGCPQSLLELSEPCRRYFTTARSQPESPSSLPSALASALRGVVDVFEGDSERLTGSIDALESTTFTQQASSTTPGNRAAAPTTLVANFGLYCNPTPLKLEDEDIVLEDEALRQESAEDLCVTLGTRGYCRPAGSLVVP